MGSMELMNLLCRLVWVRELEEINGRMSRFN